MFGSVVNSAEWCWEDWNEYIVILALGVCEQSSIRAKFQMLRFWSGITLTIYVRITQEK